MGGVELPLRLLVNACFDGRVGGRIPIVKLVGNEAPVVLHALISAWPLDHMRTGKSGLAARRVIPFAIPARFFARVGMRGAAVPADLETRISRPMPRAA